MAIIKLNFLKTSYYGRANDESTNVLLGLFSGLVQCATSHTFTITYARNLFVGEVRVVDFFNEGFPAREAKAKVI